MPAPERPLILPAAVQAALRVAWEAGVAEVREPCGYLVGTLRADELWVERAPAGANVHPAPARAFALAPLEHLAARRAARADGLRVIGCWHGHLRGDARPSRADLAGLGPLGPALMLILGREPGREPPVLRAWRRDAQAAPGAGLPVREVPLLVR